METTTLGDLISLQRGYDLTEGQRRPGSVPVVGSAGVHGYHDVAKTKGPGITLGRSGASFGKVTYVKEDFWPHNTTIFVTDFKGNEPLFIRYLLESLDFSSLNSGSAQQSLNRNFLYPVAVPKVPLLAQRRIAGILSAYDELIENSQRRIKVLETMARALYREWFVHFRFPGHENHPRVPSPLGEIPQGWVVGRLDDVMVLQRGFDLPKANRAEGTVPIYAATGVAGFHNEAKVKAPGIVTGRSGTIGDVLYVQDDFWPLNTALWVKEFPKSEPLYAYYLLLSVDLKQFNSGAAVPTLNRNDIHGLDALIPPRDLQVRFQEIAAAMHAQSHKLTLKIQNLRRTRDLLLPRLLSGEVDLELSESTIQDATQAPKGGRAANKNRKSLTA